jgi:phosphatidylinositol alpha-1,6-mannosyltransferase
MPSTGEGFGIAFLEAMVSGTPALGLNIAGAKDALADGELGGCISEERLIDEIHRALTGPGPDPVALSEAARSRFGREGFLCGVRSAVNRLMEA